MLDATVIGLGTMGTALTRLLLRNGYAVTVWNRSPEKISALEADGARGAANPAAAVRASSIVVVCVSDYAVTQAVFETDGVAAALAGRVVLQLSTGAPEEARASDAWLRARGAALVTGAIQASPGQMGRPDTPILVSGAKDAFERVRPVLDIFGGRISNLGENAASVPAMDLATLSYVYGAFFGFLHGARIVETEGMRVDEFGALVAGIAAPFGEFFAHESRAIQSESYAVSESPTRISIDAVARIARHARERRINTDFPTYAEQLMQRAAAANLADEEVAAVIKILRKNGEAS